MDPPDAPREEPVPVEPDEVAIRRAADAIRDGALVVFPTETVYGVGANALDMTAVARIFKAKARPHDNPLILHVADAVAAQALAAKWPKDAQRLADAFWPGPMTLVVKRSPVVPDSVTAGLDTVALRVPNHPVAKALLALVPVPIAAPSANASGRPSPTRVEHALHDLGSAVRFYLDGGPTGIGVESTVIDVSHRRPRVLRTGGLELERIQEVLGRKSVEVVEGSSDRPAAPGMKHRHYAPRAKVTVASPGELDSAYIKIGAEGRHVAVLSCADHATASNDRHVIGPCTQPEVWARKLFAALRDMDAQGYEDVVVEAIPEQGLGRAVMDRVRRAAKR